MAVDLLLLLQRAAVLPRVSRSYSRVERACAPVDPPAFSPRKITPACDLCPCRSLPLSMHRLVAVQAGTAPPGSSTATRVQGPGMPHRILYGRIMRTRAGSHAHNPQSRLPASPMAYAYTYLFICIPMHMPASPMAPNNVPGALRSWLPPLRPLLGPASLL